MKKLMLTITVLAAVVAIAGGVTKEGFKNPPREVAPHVWWHWLNGNVTKEGIDADLDLLRDMGFGGAAIVAVGAAPKGDIAFDSDAWYEHVAYAIDGAIKRGLEICLPNCAGWSSSAGPWITPSNAMKKVVYTERQVTGGKPFDGTLEQPKKELDFYEDIAVVAYNEGSGETMVLSAQDGRCTETLPEGKWTIYRFGYTARNSVNIASMNGGRGWEVDKFDAKALDFHFDSYIGKMVKYLKARGLFAPETGKGFTSVLIDSYEVGDQDWTQNFEAEFQRRRGYDPKPFLPAFAGRNVGDRQAKQIMRDFRQTGEELFNENYGGEMARKCHEAGLKFQLEAYGRDMPGVNRHFKPEYQATCDLPMTEFWAGDTEDKYFVRTRKVVTEARKQGRRIIGAEAFTAWPRQDRWNLGPFDLKVPGDLAFSEGVNRLYLHTFSHQPWVHGMKPGLTMDQFGTHFDRNSTCWPMAKEWVRYLTRCQYMLQNGAGYFVAVTNDVEQTVMREFAETGKTPEIWDPVSGEIRAAQWKTAGGKTQVEIPLGPRGSAFVVFREAKPGDTGAVKIEQREFEVKGTWKLKIAEREIPLNRLKDWTHFDDSEVKYFSGTAEYAIETKLPKIENGERMFIDLGETRNLAKVTVNDTTFPALWAKPMRTDITDASRGGEGTVKIVVRVANLWANRLIGDDFLPEDVKRTGPRLRKIPEWAKHGGRSPSGRRTFSSFRHWTKDDAPLASGMRGPVKIIVVAEK